MHSKSKHYSRPKSTHQKDLQTGVVYKKVTGSYTIHAGERRLTCSLASALRGNSDPVAVGDRVQFEETQPGAGSIVGVLPRENHLGRRAITTGSHTYEQVIVANVGQMIPVFAAANPTPHWNMLDRYLVTSEASEVPALICITKLDLAQSDNQVYAGLKEAAAEYHRIGYRVVMVSAQTGEGVSDIKEALAGQVSVFLGKSGVGKSSLLNAIQPGLGARVSAVSAGEIGKGRHTTTHLEMFPIEGGGAIVDTPGVREFGLWNVADEDLALFYPEIRPYLGQCRFGLNCHHDEEPGCAVRKAVMDGYISPRRYQSYMKLSLEG